VADALLQVSDLAVRYGPIRAVDGVELSIRPGEVVGLIGPNGAGKSSLLLGVTGVVKPDRGDVLFDGRSILGVATEQVVRRGIGLVPEGRHVFPEFTVRENLRLGALGRSTPDALTDDLAWVEELFPVVAERREDLAGVLSGGQQQMLVIARALLSRPRVLLLDEPSLGLAPSVVANVFGALADIRDRGVAILLVEQRAQLAVEFADRTHVMRNGRFVMTLGPGEEMDVDAMASAYFGS